jgi:hypothetical protein
MIHWVARWSPFVGFEVVEHFDIAEQALRQRGFNVPWYQPLEGHFTLSGFKHTPLGRLVTAYLVGALEMLGIAAPGVFHPAQKMGTLNRVHVLTQKWAV